MTTGTTGNQESEPGTRPAQPTVFVSDPSAEAERIAQALRATGYAVVDVPMSMLLARVAVQPPRVILVDSDAEGALDAVARLRELPHAEGIDVIFLGRTGAALQGPEDALAHEGSGFFARPVDVSALLRKIEALTGGVPDAAPARSSTPPPSLPNPSRHPSALGPPSGVPPGLPPVSMRAPEVGSSRPPSRPPPASGNVGAATSATSAEPTSAPGAIAGRGSISPETTPQTSAPVSRSESRRTISIQTPLSTELETLLAEAEQRVGVQMTQETSLPTPEEEIEAVLPAEILSSLDEPIEEDEDEDFDPSGRGAPDRPITASAPVTSAGREDAKTHGGVHGASTTGLRSQSSAVETGPREASSGFAPSSAGVAGLVAATGSPPGSTTGGPSESASTGGGALGGAPVSPVAGTGPHWTSQMATELGSVPSAAYPPAVPALTSTLGSGSLQPDAGEFSGIVAPSPPDVTPAPPMNRSTKAESVPPPAFAPRVFGPGEAPLVLARAISARATGALCFESQEGVRRAVLREGDVVTASSGVDDESLLAFLGSRGDLPRERVQELLGKVPPFGRHAGAALVAHGHLRQDQLWPVLRAHAEWVLGRAMLPARGTAVLEADPPGRLRNEPSVFGGSTGAEVLVEVVRRVIPPEEAIQRLGGASSRIGDGDKAALLSECALDPRERDLLTHMRGGTVGELLEGASDADFASVLYALSLLGVVDVIRSVGARSTLSETDDAAVLALDEDAIRARVRARMDLVEEGDYFSVLGLARDATGYEVRRAFLDLRRTFEPSRILSPGLADLADDVRKIVSVLDEAYDVLRDGARRERYRRAITVAPA